MKNLGLCTQANYDVNGSHCNFPTLEPVNYIPFKYTCFFKNILCSNCVTEEKNSYNIQTCMDAAPLTANEILLANQLSIFPNPANRDIYIEGILNENANISVAVYSALGQVVFKYKEQKMNVGKMSFHITFPYEMSAGFYFAEVRIGEQVFRKKIQIQ